METVVQERQNGGIVPPPIWPEDFDRGGNSGDSGSSFPISKNQLGLWILLCSILMLFAGLSSAYIVLRGMPDWQSIAIPPVLWLNTAILLASSAAIEAARKSLVHRRVDVMKTWLLVSAGFGFAFL